jgi:hypothetical protein
MNLICLGTPQISPDQMMSQAAQDYAVTWFRDYFLRIYPTGIVISELEYRAGTTSPFGPPKGLRTPQQPGLDAVLDSLQDDFRNWVKDLDYRKCDALGISGDGLNAELLEVTTGTNAAGAIGQITRKIDILRNTVNRIHNLRLQCYPSRWQPNEYQRFRVLNSDQNQITYLCYEPTFRLAAPPGVILYEVHRVALQKVPVPVPAPSGAAERLRQAVPPGSERPDDTGERARRFLSSNPDITRWIRALMAVSLTAAIVAIMILIAPAEGAVVAVFAFAAALVRAASA